MSSTIDLPETLTIHQIDEQFSILNQKFTDAGDVIIMDAALLETIDSSGIQTLLVLVQNALENNQHLSWRNTPDVLKNAAEKLGLTSGLMLA